MATDGPTPPPCDEEIYKEGEVVLITAEVSSNRMEEWVKSVVRLSGQRVDWHNYAGRIVVKALGDTGAVRRVCVLLRPELNFLYRASLRDWSKERIADDEQAPWSMDDLV